MIPLLEILNEIKNDQQQSINWKEYTSKYPMIKAGVDALQKLEQHGKAYIVGGAVRDIISGDKVPDDIDIATDVDMDKIEQMFKAYDIGKNKQFGIVVIKHMGYDFEIAQFREDGKYFDGRRPASIRVGVDFQTDAGRRDFTINAMGVDSEGKVVDYFSGQKDIQNKVLRTVGDPEKRFQEDYLRMLRAVRFATRMGYKIDPSVTKAIKQHSSKISKVSSERATKELMKMAEQSGSQFAKAIRILIDTGLMQYILPEIVEMDEYEHSVATHPEGNVLQHTLAALEKSKSKDPIINLAILLHDIGKIRTQGYEGGKVKYIGHAEKGAEMIDDLAERLKLDNKIKSTLKFVLANHMKVHKFLDMSKSKVAKIIDDNDWDVLYNVSYADKASRGHLFRSQEWDELVDHVERLTKEIKDQRGMTTIRKVVNGNWVMELKGIKPGPQLGEYIKATVDWIIDNNIDVNDTEKIAEYVKSL